MSKRIFVIEDEAGFREVLEDVLDHAGYEVESSPYLASSVSIALRGQYDLITLDLRMPGVNGIDVAQIFHMGIVLQNPCDFRIFKYCSNAPAKALGY